MSCQNEANPGLLAESCFEQQDRSIVTPSPSLDEMLVRRSLTLKLKATGEPELVSWKPC